jgi:glyoxylase-like metal-dependent hydrolase (beta-lactamase superfamily II)
MEQQKYSEDVMQTISLQNGNYENFRGNDRTDNNTQRSLSDWDRRLNTDKTIYKNISTTVLVNGKPMKIHGLCTGTVAVKANFRTKKGYGELARLNMLLGRRFTTHLPIWVWVIEHPDGLMVIDTGEVTAIKDVDHYLSKENAFNRFLFKKVTKFDIEPQDELDHQFEKINLKLDDVKLVALTHLHLDHTDGLQFFPKAEIIVGDVEYRNPATNMPSTYPGWFNPNRVKYQDNQIDVFDKAYLINKNLFYVPTPGHTRGHSSIVFKTDEFDIIFAGDTSYNQEQVLTGELAGVNVDYKKSRETYASLLAYASKNKTIYLPSHDENAAIRLRDRILLPGNKHMRFIK